MYLRMVGSSPSSSPVCPWRSSTGSRAQAEEGMRLGRCSDCSGRLMNSFFRALSGAEVRDRRGTADPLNPDVLDSGDVGGDVVGGDDHLGGKGLIVTVTGAVEVGQQHHRVLVGAGGLQGLGGCPGQLEG